MVGLRWLFTELNRSTLGAVLLFLWNFGLDRSADSFLKTHIQLKRRFFWGSLFGGFFLRFFDCLSHDGKLVIFDQIGIFQPAPALLNSHSEPVGVFYLTGVITMSKFFAIALKMFGGYMVINSVDAPL